MKFSLFLFVGLVAGATFVAAAPITYNITFTATSGLAPTSGTFTYDSALPTFTAFTVVWDGLNFDLTAAANAPTIGRGCGSVVGTALVTFTEILQVGSLAGSCFFPQTWIAERPQRFPGIAAINLGGPTVLNGDTGVEALTMVGPGGFFGGGSFTITQTSAVPEPATIWLIAAGGGILAVRRRRDSATSCRTFPQ